MAELKCDLTVDQIKTTEDEDEQHKFSTRLVCSGR